MLPVFAFFIIVFNPLVFRDHKRRRRCEREKHEPIHTIIIVCRRRYNSGMTEELLMSICFPFYGKVPKAVHSYPRPGKKHRNPWSHRKSYFTSVSIRAGLTGVAGSACEPFAFHAVKVTGWKAIRGLTYPELQNLTMVERKNCRLSGLLVCRICRC